MDVRTGTRFVLATARVTAVGARERIGANYNESLVERCFRLTSGGSLRCKFAFSSSPLSASDRRGSFPSTNPKRKRGGFAADPSLALRVGVAARDVPRAARPGGLRAGGGAAGGGPIQGYVSGQGRAARHSGHAKAESRRDHQGPGWATAKPAGHRAGSDRLARANGADRRRRADAERSQPALPRQRRHAEANDHRSAPDHRRRGSPGAGDVRGEPRTANAAGRHEHLQNPQEARSTIEDVHRAPARESKPGTRKSSPWPSRSWPTGRRRGSKSRRSTIG